MTRKTALIVGATGLVGGYCLKEILKSDHYEKVISVGRRQISQSHPKLEQLIMSFDENMNFTKIKKIDDVFCCLGTTINKAGSKSGFRTVDFEYPVLVARLAKDKMASQYLLISSLGANPDSLIFYSKTKGETEQAIKESGIEKIKIFRPSLLQGERLETRTGEDIYLGVSKLMPFLFWGPFSAYKPVLAQDVARVMVHQANQNNVEKYKIYESADIQNISDSI